MIAGSSRNGLLTEELSMLYSIDFNNTFTELINETQSITVGMEEPFAQRSVSIDHFIPSL